MKISAMAAVALAVSSGPTFALHIAVGETRFKMCQSCHHIGHSLAVLLPYTQRGAKDTERAEDSVGPALICNTPQQLNRFVDLINGGRDAMDAVRLVNDEAKNPTACGNALAAFEIGKTLAAVKMLGELVSIVEVRVTALSDGSEWPPSSTNHPIHAPPDSRQDAVMGRLAANSAAAQ